MTTYPGIHCPLCHDSVKQEYTCQHRVYYQCQSCCALFMAFENRPDPQQEKSRYLEHNNDVNDIRYQRFVSPIVQAVKQDFLPPSKGLDFGAGTGPVITSLLSKAGYNLQLYDPFFHPCPQALETRYDFIICCEVIEHFFYPAKEFALLRQLLNPGGRLYCMTQLFDENIDLCRWNYAHDPTHVFFYHPHSIDYIKKQFNFSTATLCGRLIVFTADSA